MTERKLHNIHNSIFVLRQLQRVGRKEEPKTAYQVAPYSQYARSTIDAHLRAAVELGYVVAIQEVGRTGWIASKYAVTNRWIDAYEDWARAEFLQQQALPF